MDNSFDRNSLPLFTQWKAEWQNPDFDFAYFANMNGNNEYPPNTQISPKGNYINQQTTPHVATTNPSHMADRDVTQGITTGKSH